MIATQEDIKLALSRPDSFAYWGDLDMFNTWGLCGPSRHRDSDPLDVSNFEVITNDLIERFPDDFDIVGSSHWAVGWIDQCAVRVLDDEGNSTEAFDALLEWSAALSDYPVADEEDYSRREHEDFVETIEQCYVIGYDLIEETPEDWAENVASWLFNEYSICNSDELRDEYVEEALNSLGYVEDDEDA